MKNLTKTLYTAIVTLALTLNCSITYGATAGHVQFVSGSVQLTTEAGKKHQIQKGDEVNEGDILTTAPAAAAQIRMEDGGIIAVRPDTRLKFESFKFNGKQDGTEQSFFSLFQGGFRAVTGLIGRLHKPNYRIITPTATIGIRGTDHETFVVTRGSPLSATTPVGTYNKVNLGETSMTNGKGAINVLPNQMGFAAADQIPQLMPLNLNIFTVVPAPQAKGKQEGGMRDSTVVDGALQEQNILPKGSLPTSANFALIPITATYTTTTTIIGVAGQPITVNLPVTF